MDRQTDRSQFHQLSRGRMLPTPSGTMIYFLFCPRPLSPVVNHRIHSSGRVLGSECSLPPGAVPGPTCSRPGRMGTPCRWALPGVISEVLLEVEGTEGPDPASALRDCCSESMATQSWKQLPSLAGPLAPSLQRRVPFGHFQSKG